MFPMRPGSKKGSLDLKCSLWDKMVIQWHRKAPFLRVYRFKGRTMNKQ